MPKVLAFTRNRRRRTLQDTDLLHTAGGMEAARSNGQLPRGTPSSLAQWRARHAADGVDMSVVVATCGRPEMLNRCLASLVLQYLDPARFEIIIVDDMPSEETRAVVKRWAEHTAGEPQITYMHNARPRGLAAARNVGWRAARGRIIAFTDEDSIAVPDWLENGLRVFHGDVQAAWGRIVISMSEDKPTDFELDAKKLESAEFVTANCFCLKEVLENVGGFDERFRGAWREDADLYFRLLDSRAHITHAPKALVTHPVSPARWGESLAQLRKSQFDALLYKKHPAHYRQRIHGTPRWDYYLAVAALVGAPAALALEETGVALMAMIIWLSLTARLSLKRLSHTARSPSNVSEVVLTSALIPPVAVFWRMVGSLRFRVGFL